MKREPYLAAPSETIRILQKYGFNFQKKYGQNFLIDPRVLEKIAAASRVSADDAVIEIGPGIGTLTQYMAYYADRVYAVEIDRSLIPILDDTLSDWDNVKVIQGDIMDLDLEELFAEAASGKAGEEPAEERSAGCDAGKESVGDACSLTPQGACSGGEKRKGGSGTGRVRVVANLPYYITTPILMKLLESGLPFASVTVMVQKEVAERMQAGPGGKEYGALSLAVQYYSRPHIDALVPPNCFMPRPNVGSAVITLDLDSSRRLPKEKEGKLFRVIRASFAQRRKTLGNCLSHSEEISCSKEQIAAVLNEMGLDERIRGERLSLDQFIELADKL